MTTGTSTSSSSSSGPQTSQVLLIVELLERIGSHLNPPDLLSCVQVSQHWNTVLIPHLWHTIDDRLYSWACILNVYLSHTAPRPLRIVKAEQDTSSSIKESTNAIEEAKVLKHIALDVWPSRRAEIAHWLYRIFQKYGRHIRTLRVSWPDVYRPLLEDPTYLVTDHDTRLSRFDGRRLERYEGHELVKRRLERLVEIKTRLERVLPLQDE